MGTTANAPGAGRRVIRVGEVCAITGLSRTSIWRRSKDTQDPFPAGIELGPNSHGWFEDEVHAWLAGRPRTGKAITLAPAAAQVGARSKNAVGAEPAEVEISSAGNRNKAQA